MKVIEGGFRYSSRVYEMVDFVYKKLIEFLL